MTAGPLLLIIEINRASLLTCSFGRCFINRRHSLERLIVGSFWGSSKRACGIFFEQHQLFIGSIRLGGGWNSN